MSYPAEFLRRLRMIFHRRQLDADLEEEMRLHLALRAQQQIDSGLPASAARRASPPLPATAGLPIGLAAAAAPRGRPSP